jgi:ABC-type nitrate/sulfonate/bicarbonate transport system substrate-binding protein
MKSLFQIVVVVLLTGVALQVNSTVHAKTITVAYPSPSWNTSLPVSTARDFGIFAAEGLDVRPVYVRGGPVVMAALLSGEADYAIMAGVTAVTSIARGAEVVIVGGHTAYIDQVLVGAKNVTKLADLKGKVVGVTGAGGVTEFATVEALARKGLVRDRDYSVLYAGNSPARVNALESGVIHAGAFSANEKVVMDERGFPLLLETGKALPEFPFMVVVTYRQKLKSNPTEVVAFLRALRNAMNVIQTSKDKVIAAAAKKDPNANVNVLRKSLDYTLDSFSIALAKKNIQALVSAAKLNVNLDAPGVGEKFFVDDFLTRTLSVK